jgi:LacI family transcriptional regulator
MHEVARLAGVSLATVDRALNQRPGVSARTLQKVQQAVQTLAQRPAVESSPRTGARLLCFLLPAGDNGFVTELREALHALAPWLAEQDARVDIRSTDAFAPAAAAAAVRRLRGQFDAVVLMLQDHPLVREAVERMAGDGTCVLTLVSDVEARNRSHFIGIDNVAAGRTAASLMGRFVGARSGCIGIVMGSPALRDHAARLAGFRQLMAADRPELQLLEPLACHDHDAHSEALTRELIASHDDLVGLYAIGAGQAGVHAALQASGRSGRIAWICHELTPHTRAALLDGSAKAVIGQNARLEAGAACRVALARLSRQRVPAEDERIRIEIYLKDNLP